MASPFLASRATASNANVRFCSWHQNKQKEKKERERERSARELWSSVRMNGHERLLLLVLNDSTQWFSMNEQHLMWQQALKQLAEMHDDLRAVWHELADDLKANLPQCKGGVVV